MIPDDTLTRHDGSPLRWEDVHKIHRTRAGVYARAGQIISLLMSQSAYWDTVTNHEIRYGISLSTSAAVLRAFESALSKNYPIRVFYKHAPNLWEDLGFFKVISVEPGTIRSGAEFLYYRLVRIALS